MNNKQVILEIEAVYTANAFSIGSEFYIGAGSETKPEVYLYDMRPEKAARFQVLPVG